MEAMPKCAFLASLPRTARLISEPVSTRPQASTKRNDGPSFKHGVGGNGRAAVSAYEMDESASESLSLLRFEGADAAWLDFVVENRKGLYKGELYDLVIGPVANDRTMSVINDYMNDQIDRETALILLKPQNLSDQYRFGTETALRHLTCKEVRLLD